MSKGQRSRSLERNCGPKNRFCAYLLRNWTDLPVLQTKTRI